MPEFEGGYNPEEEKSRERVNKAKNLFRDFVGIKPDERVLFLTDKDPHNTDRELIAVLQAAVVEMGNQFSELEATGKLSQRKLFEAVSNHQIIWNSWGMADTKIDFYDLADHVEEIDARMTYSPGLKVHALDKDGSLTESKADLDYRLAKMEQRLRDVQGMNIKTTYGTDLTLSFKQGERRWIKDAGDIGPGDWDNFPGGEIYTTPDEESVNGVLVLPILQDEVTLDQGVDEFVRLNIRNGKIATIDGGKSADKLRTYLEGHSSQDAHVTSIITIAEVGFGANSKARFGVTNPEGRYADPAGSTVEAEKRLGTMHLAFGSSKHGVPGSEGHTESIEHLDFVIPRNGLTVTVFKTPDDFAKGKNGERLIVDGGWNFT
ncbi:MAG: aminopeptidase [Candidatus Doudnabacteria bacterium]|nr:aminopeptidase [Candidatus Doudnabacteria bacterium]